MASRFSIDAIYRLVDQFSGPSKKIKNSSKNLTNILKTDFAKAQRQVNRFGESLKRNAWIGVTAAVAGIGLLAKKGIDLASDLAEVQNVVDVSFENNSEIINEWSKNAITKFGLSELMAKKFNGTMGAMLKSSGLAGDEIVKMSTDLVGLAGDFASFYNLDPEGAFNKIRSGISGETEPLKQLGINMSVANLEAFALTQGIDKQYKKMTQAEQATLRYNYLMKVASDAQGDFSRTLKTSLANQKRVLETKFNQKLAETFQKLIPELINLTEEFNKFLDTIDTGTLGKIVLDVFNVLKDLGSALVFVFNVLKPLAPVILTIVAAFMAYKAGMLIAAAATVLFNVAMSANVIAWVAVAIGVLTTAIIFLVKNFDAVKKGLDDFFFFLDDVINGAIYQVVKAFGWLGEQISGGFMVALDGVGNFFGFIGEQASKLVGIFAALGSVIIDKVVSAFEFMWSIIEPIITAIGDFTGGVGDFFGGAIGGIGDFFGGIGQGIGNFFGGGSKEAATPIQSPVSPTERAATITNNKNTTGEIIINDNSGRASIGRNIGSPYNLKLKNSGAF